MTKLKSESAKKNYIYQFAYQAIILVIPLFVSPYLTRTLGSTSLGIYTYTYSIAYYFVIVAMLGIARHGQRIIASRRDDETKLRKTFWSLFSVHAVVSVFALIAYIIYAVFICSSDNDIALIQALYVLSALFDITWLFQGLENFKSVVIRNAIVKILETICIFIFVRDPSDIAIYTLIVSASVLLGQCIMVPRAIVAIKPIKFGWVDVKEHFKPMLTLFVLAVSATLYTIFDKTLLGILSTKENVAFYEYSNKIINIPKTFITVIGGVLFPRACRLAEKGDEKGMKKYMDYSLLITFFIGMASCFGLLAVGDLLAVEYYGNDFAICGDIIISMCPLVLICGLGDVVRTQYIYPMKKDNIMVIILACNAVINLVLSVLLIPVLGVYGAVIGTTAAELFGLIVELFMCRKVLKIREIFKYFIPFAVIGAIMFGVIELIAYFYTGTIAALIVQVIVGAILYITLSAVYLLVFNKNIRSEAKTIINKIFKRKSKEDEEKL